MFGFKNNSLILKTLEPGQLVKFQGKYHDYISRRDVKNTFVFVFGHLDENNSFYWQDASVILDKNNPNKDYVYGTAKVESEQIFEQIKWEYKSGRFSLPTKEETERFENAVDSFYIKKWNDGIIQPRDIHFRTRLDGKLSIIKLTIDPPKYMYGQSTYGRKYIFEFGSVSFMTCVADTTVYSKGSRLIDDRYVSLGEPLPYLNGSDITRVNEYSNFIELRVATKAEEKQLLAHRLLKERPEETKTQENKEQQKSEKLSLYGEVYRGDIVYAEIGRDRNRITYIFPYGGHVCVDGIEHVQCTVGYLRIYPKGRKEFTPADKAIDSYFDFTVFRKANENEVTVYKNAYLKNIGHVPAVPDIKNGYGFTIILKGELVVLEKDDIKYIIKFNHVFDDFIDYKESIKYLKTEDDYFISQFTEFQLICPNEYKNVRMALESEEKLFNDYMSHYGQEGISIRKSHADYCKSHAIENNEMNHKTKKSNILLRPFVTKVLVSDGLGDVWRPAIFGGIAKRDKRYMVVGGMLFKYCVPFSRHRDWLGKEFAASDVPTTPGFVTKSVSNQET